MKSNGSKSTTLFLPHLLVNSDRPNEGFRQKAFKLFQYLQTQLFEAFRPTEHFSLF